MSSDALRVQQFASPPQLKNLKIFGSKICYYDAGEGPPLVLVHGLGADADVWAFCLNAFSVRHRTIALDLLGFGRSDKPFISYRMAVFVELLEEFLRRLGIQRASLVGSSLGGWIVAAFALKFPNMVENLILNDAVGIGEGMTSIPIDLNISTRAHMREVLEFMFHNKNLVTDEFVDLSYEQHLVRNDGYTIRSALDSCSDRQEVLDNGLTGLRVPTLLVWGAQDEMSPPPVAESFHRRIAASRLIFIPECGHIPALEKPEELVREVLMFLDRSPSSAVSAEVPTV